MTKILMHLAMAAGGLALVALGGISTVSGNAAQDETRDQLFDDGNYREALELYREACVDPAARAERLPHDLRRAVTCLQQLGRTPESDDLIEQTVAAHPANGPLLHTAALLYQELPHHGFLVAGEYLRGGRRGGGTPANSIERDRVRALQLMEQALPRFTEQDRREGTAQFLVDLSRILLNQNGAGDAWRLQLLTDLTTLPPVEEGYPGYRQNVGAPVDEQGDPLFFDEPRTWEEAASDGERWRWALGQAEEMEPSQRALALWERATVSQDMYGVATLATGSFFPMPLRGEGEPGEPSEEAEESGTYALHTLAEDETIARLAVGVRRFTLPPDYHYIALFQELAETDGNYAEQALDRLAREFENRRQYPKAASYWRNLIERFGGENGRREQLAQIVEAWGRFERVDAQPAGEGAEVYFRFRNAEQVTFTAHRINIERLLEDVKRHIRSRPDRLDGEQINVDNIGWRLVQRDQQQYVGEEVARWTEQLTPLPDHFDRLTRILPPMRQAGAYLVTAEVEDGNTSHVVLWLQDLAILQKPTPGSSVYYVADARTGEPVAEANVEFFGYRQERVQGNRYRVDTVQFAEITGEDGLVIPDDRDLVAQHQWLVTARDGEDRLAFLGFHYSWTRPAPGRAYGVSKAFGMTDRPVYRPEHSVHYKFWLREARYDLPDSASKFAGAECRIFIMDPRGETVAQIRRTADAYGGVEGVFEIADDARLGTYQMLVETGQRGSEGYVSGRHQFRVEEYRTPEFEVTVEGPEEPASLGEVVQARIAARYYFGAPVTDAVVQVKVTRSPERQYWFPPRPWDWLYGPGYWWTGYDYAWLPGWESWSRLSRPAHPIWFPMPMEPPEVVAEFQAPLGPDGSLTVDIDTALAKRFHGDTDHRYTITAEVRDASRRTIVGQGDVLVARYPYRVYTWVDRGFYQVDDEVQARFQARSPDGSPVELTGQARLFRLRYDVAGDPDEELVEQWDVATNEQGTAELTFRAAAAGQYRLSFLTEHQDAEQEGVYVFTVRGESFDSGDYRFAPLEVVVEKPEYAVGETVRIQVNTERPGSTVLFFTRPANGVYSRPQVLRLDGKSRQVELEVQASDMPNFFVEAVTIADGEIHTEVREVVVPPESRLLDVTVVPSQETFRPGEEASVELLVRGPDGEPFVGAAVLTVYDRALDYIAGDEQVANIREFFWKWRRQHSVAQSNNLDRTEPNLTDGPEARPMQDLGLFGSTVIDEVPEARRRFSGSASAPGGLERGGVEMQAMRGDVVAAEADKGPGDSVLRGPTPAVRSEFADTAVWQGDLQTDDQGRAVVQWTMPDNLTTWKILAWSVGHGTRVGQAEAEVVTTKDLVVRLQAPRFFIERDEVVLSANVHNYLEESVEVDVSIELEGGVLEMLDEPSRVVSLDPDGGTRVDWRVRALSEGTAIIRMLAVAPTASDAVERSVPCYVHGMLRTESYAGTVRRDQSGASLTVHIPEERRELQSRVEVRFSPTLAGAMVDALPYLVSYPYGCTEQTLNRFLPTVITQQVLLEMNLNLDAIRDKRTNLNPQELGDAAQRAEQWQRHSEWSGVFDESEVDRMVREGLKELAAMQLSDGGWGWFSGWGERSMPHTTAMVVHGLQIARENDVPVVPGVLDAGVEWLKTYQEEQVRRLQNASTKTRPWKEHPEAVDALVYMVLVDAGVTNDAMGNFLYEDRNQLSVYAKTLLALALHRQQDVARRDMVRRNIEQFLQQDSENETAWLQLPPERSWWYWHHDEVEANAYYLKLLVAVEPESRVAPRLVKYLLNQRKHATYWSSTRDTALCIEAFSDYLRATDELRPEMVVEVWWDGERQMEVQITPDSLFTFDNTLVLTGKQLTAGSHELEIRRSGEGPLYFNAYVTNFTLEDFIPRAGLEVEVQRRYFRLVPVRDETHVPGTRGQPEAYRVDRFERVPLDNLDEVASGQMVEVELVIDSRNDYEYLLFEDFKPAGFEAVEQRSGYIFRGLQAYQEVRDNRVAFFVTRLARGRHSLTYRLRAEAPGRFSALPAVGRGMYAPELRGNSDEIKLRVVDEE